MNKKIKKNKEVEIKMKIRKITMLTIAGLISVLGISCGKTGSEIQKIKMSKEVKSEKKSWI